MSEKSDDRKISEALDVLEEMAKSRKAELMTMVANSYSNLEEMFSTFADDLGTRVKETVEEGKEKVVGLAKSVDKMVRKNPWPYIGGAALIFLILGAFQGRSRK